MFSTKLATRSFELTSLVIKVDRLTCRCRLYGRGFDFKRGVAQHYDTLFSLCIQVHLDPFF
jgi:hypothetical protein